MLTINNYDKNKYAEIITNHYMQNCNCFHCINKYKYNFTINKIMRQDDKIQSKSSKIRDIDIIKSINNKSSNNDEGIFIYNMDCMTFDLDYSKLINVKYFGIIYSDIKHQPFNTIINSNLKYLNQSLKLLLIDKNNRIVHNLCLSYLPNKLDHLYLYGYDNKLDKLSILLQYLNIGRIFKDRIDNLPSFLKDLRIGLTNYNRNVNNLPDSIEFLAVTTSHRINKLPKSLIHLVLYKDCLFPGYILNHVKNVIIK